GGGGVMEIALAGFAGFHTTTPPSSETAFGVYRPAYVARSALTHVLVDADGTRHEIPDPPTGAVPPARIAALAKLPVPSGPTRRAPLGSVLGARSGDKGGNANLGLWARDDPGYAWARDYLSVERLRTLLGPETAHLPMERFELPNLRALNVVVHGLLGDGVASSTRLDAQAKGLGEYVRSRMVDIPQSLLDTH
ncbi:exopolyphosphatase, partial [Mycobacteroides abscessus subsp. massiliense]